MPTATTGRRRWLTLAVLSLGVSLIVVDGTIVNVALPVIIRDLGLDYSGAEWVSTIYALVFAALLLTAGRLGDRLGRRRLFAIGVVVFVGGSLLAGMATDQATLLGARVLQGIGGALILPSTLSTVNATFHGRDRAIAFAVWGSVIAGMAAIGPLLGGWLTTSVSWRWIFLINLPIGALILIGIVLFVGETRGHGFAPGLDVDGFLLSSIGLAALVFGLVEGRTYGWLTPTNALRVGDLTWPVSAPISLPAAAIVLGVALLVLFVLWERHRARIGRSALLDLSLFGFRSFRWGNLAVLLVALGEFGLLFTLPLYLQNVLGLSALGSGAVLASMAVGAFLAGGLAGRLTRRMSSASVASLGLAIEASALLVIALVVGPATQAPLVAIVLIAYGVGLGLSSAQLTGVILADVPPDQSGQGSATQSTTRQVGSALGVAVLGTILGTAITAGASGSLAHVAGLSPSLVAQLEVALGDSAGGIIEQIRNGLLALPPGTADAVIAALSSAFADATRVTMLAGAAFLLVGLAASLRLPRTGDATPPARPAT